MFLTKKSLRSYVGLYQKFLYKRFNITDTPPLKIILAPSLMLRRIRLGQGSQFHMLLNKLRLSALVSDNLPKTLPTQWLDDLRLKHQYQVTRCGISYKAVFFYSTIFTGDTFCCAKGFAVVQEGVAAGGLFYKYPDPPPLEIQNLTAPPSAPGDPIEAVIFNVYNWA